MESVFVGKINKNKYFKLAALKKLKHRVINYSKTIDEETTFDRK
jgi:hypothetical protein